ELVAGRTAEFAGPPDEGTAQLAPRQKALVDEVDAARARCDEPVEFVDDRRKRPAAVAVAEIVLGAEGAMIGTTARHLHFGAGAMQRSVKAMVVMRVPLHDVGVPAQGRQPRHIDGLRPALHDDVLVVMPHQAGDGAPRFAWGVGEFHQHFLAFALYARIDAKLLHRNPWRR